MIMPVLAVMFLASFDGGRAIAVYMKVRAATFALAAITNQYSTIQSTDMTSIVGAASTVMAPYPSTPSNPVITISQITISSKGKATISWSYSQGGTARTGSSITLPATALDINSTYLILAEVSYTFTPLFGFFTAGALTFPIICTLLRASAIASIIRRRASQAASLVSRGGVAAIGQFADWLSRRPAQPEFRRQ